MEFSELPSFEIFESACLKLGIRESEKLFFEATAKIAPTRGARLRQICGGPGSGKSTTCLEISGRALRAGRRVTFLDTEGSCPGIQHPAFTLFRTFDATGLLATVREISREVDLLIIDSVGFAFRHSPRPEREGMLRVLVDALLGLSECEVVLINQTTTREGAVYDCLGKVFGRLVNARGVY